MEQENLFWFVMDEITEIVLMFNSSGIITYANGFAKNSFDYQDDLYGKCIDEIFPSCFHKIDDTFTCDVEFNQIHKDVMAYRKNRTCFPVEVRFIKNMASPSVNFCFAKDVSAITFLNKEIGNVEQEVNQAEKVKTEFVANVTHELRTPVNGILGNTLVLLERENDPAKERILRLIEHGCNDMQNIINNILDFSKLEAGKFTLENRKFLFRDMIEYVKGNHINKIVEKGLDFFVTVSPEVPEYIIGDELRLTQILNNLLSNACKFTTVGKVALEVVKTAQVNNRVELFFLVIDRGIGIAKNDQDKLFGSFSQVDASISRRYGGTGLGLNISKQLVELMGGSITVESDLGEGTMFCFSAWVELPEEELQSDTPTIDVYTAMSQVQSTYGMSNNGFSVYGTQENLNELDNKLSKMILCVEMENWEKAEMFVEVIRELTSEAPKEVKTAALKLKMSVQKENYEKIIEAYDLLKGMIGR